MTTQTPDVDHWPTPDNSTYLKAARRRCELWGYNETLSPAEFEQMVAQQATSQILRATVDAVWEDRLPTAAAYSVACRALGNHRDRADQAEAVLSRVRDLVGRLDDDKVALFNEALGSKWAVTA